MTQRKGQAAMEFLMTYGWAILVVLAAIGALAYFGVLSPDRFLPSKCTVAGGFSCIEYKVTATEVQMNIQNNLGVDATSVNITMTGKSGGTFGTTNCARTFILLNGDATNVTAYCTGGTLAGKVRADITIVYQKSGETVTHTTTGSVSGNVEQ
ncbi:hypothetical protein C4573_07225 [Candidatus Woesearchaeota archaeon]|nr:MAG: hypothetical protein C4573_07225 [Candidatus Woesearchaeota archaeon]